MRTSVVTLALLSGACTPSSAPAPDDLDRRALVLGMTSGLASVAAGELIISEFLKDPLGTDNPQEWIEIHNLHAQDVDLDGLVVSEIVAGNSFTIGTPFIVPAGGRVVLGEVADPDDNGGVPVDIVYGFDALPLFNDGGEIVLSFGATEFDRVAYDDSTFPNVSGSSISLDDDDFTASGNDTASNWCASDSALYGGAFSHGNLGTPGLPNVDCNSKDLDGDGFIDIAYGGDDCDDEDAGINPGETEDNNDAVDEDCDGFLADTTAADLVHGDLVITEIHNNAAAVTDGFGEWFEVRIDTAGPVDLKGLIARSQFNGGALTEEFALTDSMLRFPGDRVVFAVNDDVALNGNVPADYDWSGFNLYDSSDFIDLLTPGEVLIDNVTWDNGATFPDPSGASMVLEPTLSGATLNDDGSNWCTATIAWPGSFGDFGSPGAVNQSCLDRDGDGEVSTQFGGTDCDDTNPAVGLGHGVEIEDNGIDEDCDGIDAFLGIAALSPGDLVITEIHNDPTGGYSDEWFEILNTSAQRVDIAGIEVVGNNSGPGTSSFFPGSVVMDPGEYVVFARLESPITNGGVTDVAATWTTGWGLLNSSDAITLQTPTVIDSVSYSDSGGSPNVFGAAIALEVSLSDATSNDVLSNWCDAYTAFGDGDLGSPGAANPPCIGRDVDGDTFVDGDWGGDDCDDKDPGLNPGIPEIPDDGIDQNCDGSDALVTLDDLPHGALVITELMLNPTLVEDPRGEWFEVRNAAGQAVDLNGLVLENESQTTAVDEVIYLEDGETALFVTWDDPLENGGINSFDFEFISFSLFNGDDRLTLKAPDGDILDEVDWDNGVTFPDPAGSSLQLDPAVEDATSNDTGSNWCIGRQLYGDGHFGTPGTANDSCTWAIQFDYDYFHDTDPGLDFSATTTVTLHADGLMETGNFGEGTSVHRSIALGQSVNWQYIYLNGDPGVSYTGSRAFGDACYTGTIANAPDYTGTWSGCEVPVPPSVLP